MKKELRTRLAHGWVAMLLLFIVMLLTSVLRAAMAGDFGELLIDPGTGGLKFQTVLLCVYAVMPVVIWSVDTKAFRWAAVVLTGFVTLLMIAHQLVHHYAKGIPFGVHSLVDVTHHIIGIWTFTLAVKWTRID